MVALSVLGKKWPKVPWAIVIAFFGIMVGYLASSGILPELLTLEGIVPV
jgi:hypothetical protein